MLLGTLQDCSSAPVRLFSGNLRLFATHFLIYLPVVLLLQSLTGVYRSELSHQPDESAHVVTSLMIHDYLTTGLGTSPLRYAKNYYVQYPKVAIGIWPPLFHSTAALWMLLFTRTSVALLVFVAFQCTACAATLAVFGRRLFPPWAAFALGLFMIFLPAFQTATSTVMVDIFVAMMQLWVMLLMIALFRTGSMKIAIWFGICTGLAMLTKGNANSLVLSGAFMVLLTRRFSILKRPPIYVAGAIIVLIAGPWQFFMLHSFQSHGNPLETVTLARSAGMLADYTSILALRLSLPIFLFALLGLAAECIPIVLGRRKDQEMLDVAGAGAMVLGIVLFHSFAPIGLDDRYMIPVLPLLLVFSALGIRWVSRVLQVPRLSLMTRTSILTGLCFLWFAKTTLGITHRPEMGFQQIAAELLPARAQDETVLVCSDAWGEGALITSLAFHDRQGYSHIVLRGSKF